MSEETSNNINLNEKQKHAYNLMTSGKSIFVTGPGGVGKSALIKIFTKNHKLYKKIAVTSTTGTSALLLNGTTFHSYLGIGFGTSSTESLVRKINEWSWLRRRWQSLGCLIIDEISMMNPDLFDKLEQIARFVRKNDKPFGGIQLILSGDFLQLPVVGTESFCFEAKTWDKCIDETIYLTEIIRQRDVKFQLLLNNVRLGNINNQVKQILDSRKNIKLHNEFGIKPTKLYSTNCDVDKINEIELDKLAINDVEFYEYTMDICVYGSCSNKYNIIEKFKKSCNAPEILQLCVGAQVMLLKNLDLNCGLANGSRGVVTKFFDDIPVVKFINGQERMIEINTWEVEEQEKPILSAKQIPLRIAYAMSIHKSQGCSLDIAEIDLSKIFEYGQAYVALSRVKQLSGLSIVDIDYNNIVAHPKAVEFYERHK